MSNTVTKSDAENEYVKVTFYTSLLLCLGYSIVMNTLEKYSQAIGILTFLLFVASCCNYTVEVINQ